MMKFWMSRKHWSQKMTAVAALIDVMSA